MKLNLCVYTCILSTDFLSIGILTAQPTGGEMLGPPAVNLFRLWMAANALLTQVPRYMFYVVYSFQLQLT